MPEPNELNAQDAAGHHAGRQAPTPEVRSLRMAVLILTIVLGFSTVFSILQHRQLVESQARTAESQARTEQSLAQSRQLLSINRDLIARNQELIGLNQELTSRLQQ